jgi:hypothetical protein
MGSEEKLAGTDNNQGLPSTVVCGLFKTVEIDRSELNQSTCFKVEQQGHELY